MEVFRVYPPFALLWVASFTPSLNGIVDVDKLINEEDDADKGWKLSLECSTYEVDRAERQYQQVEPENRLVARSLEASLLPVFLR